MSLFEYKLKELKDVSMWGDESNKHLHWYGLTDGSYFFNLKDKKLFQYSDKIIEFWKKDKNELNLETNYVTYQIARLHEDLLEIIPDILQPIPKDIFKYIENYEKQTKLQTHLQDLYESLDDESDLLDIYSLASDCLDLRRLSTGHLTNGPNIWFLLCDDIIYIRWNNENSTEKGIPIWSSLEGEITLTKDEFIAEVQLFHQRLMSDMDKRIQTIINSNPIPQITIDIDVLNEEHEKRKNTLKQSFTSPTDKVAWNLVNKALDTLLKV